MVEMPNVDWRDAYKRRADFLSASIGIEDAEAKARSERRKSSDLANAAFRESIKNAPVRLNQPSTPSADSELEERIQKGGWDGFLASGEKTLNEPVVKGILNALSVGTYTSAALANSGVEISRADKEGGPAAALGEMFDQTINHNPIVMGIKGAFGDEDSQRTYGDVIKNVQSFRGEDTESKEAQLAQGIGGFIGDVALDPTTYMTLGAAPFVKGAVTGAREGMSVAKAVARGALADANAKGASLAGTEIERIANNSKGVIGSAIEGAKKEHGKWKGKRATEKSDRADIRSLRTGELGTLDKESATVGFDAKEFQEGLDARNALRDKEQADIAAAEIERKARLAEEAYAASLRTPEENLAEAIDDVESPGPVSTKELPTEKVDLNDELNRADIKTEIENAKTSEFDPKPNGTPVIPEKRPNPIANAPFFEKFEKRWVKQKHKNPKLLSAMNAPAKLRKLEEITDWDGVLEDFKKFPDTPVMVAGKHVKAGSIVRNVEESGGDAHLLADLDIDPAFTQAHRSTMKKIPNGRGVITASSVGRKKGMGEFTGRTAESKDKKRLQKQAGKIRVKKDGLGPDQAEFGTRTGLYIDGKVNDDLIFDVNKILDEDSDFNYNEFMRHADENGDEIITVRDPKTGVAGLPISLSDFAVKLEAAVSDEIGVNTVNKYLRSNPLLFAKFDLANDVDDIAGDWADYQKALDEWENGADDVAEEATEEVDELDEILDDGFDREPNWVEYDNPDVWTPEKAKEFGLGDDEIHLSPAEIQSLMVGMSTTDIRRFITSKEGGISKGELDELRQFTGKTDAKEVADEFIKLRTEFNKAKKEAAKPVKPTAPTRKEEVQKIMQEGENLKPEKATPEKLDEIHEENARVANEIAASPVALDEVAQRDFRLRDYDMALKKEMPEELSGVLSREHANDAARQAVKASIEEQTKDGKFLTNQDYRTMTESIETGGAWRPDRWGSNSQIALHTSVYKYVMGLDIPTGKWKPTVRRKAYMSILEVADKELRAMGVEPFLNHVTQQVGKQGATHAANLSYFDILKSLEVGGFKKPLETLITGARTYQVTQVQGAAETIVKMRASGLEEEVIRKRAIKQLIGSRKETEKFGRPGNNADKSDQFTRGRIEAMRFQGRDKAPLPQMTAIRGRVNDARVIVDALMDPKTYQAMTTQMMVNHAAHASTLGKNVDDLAKETLDTLNGLKTAGTSGDVLGYLRGQLKDISSRFSPADVVKAKALFDERMSEHITKAEQLSLIESTKRADAIRPKPAVVKEKMEAQAVIRDNGKPVSEDFHKAAPQTQPMQAVINKSHVNEVEAAEKQALEMAPEGAEDFEIIGASIAAAAMRKIHPLQKFVNPRLGLSENIYRAANSGLHSIARQQAEFHGSLLTHLAKYGDEALLTDFRELQRVAKEAGPVTKDSPFLLPLDASESMKELYGIVTVMFDKSAYNVFARNGVGANHFNALANANGLPKKWRFEQGADAYTNSTLWMNWEGIEEKGVLDFLSRMHSIAIKASQDIAIAASFSKNFGKAVPEPGDVKIKWTNMSRKDTEESVFYDLIDKELYYPKDVATQVTQIDKMMRESRHIDPSTATGKFIVNVFDPITNALKASQTTVRPGHWVISFVGDLMRNQLAGVNTFMPYKHAANIMMEGKKMLSGEGDEFYSKIATAKQLKEYGISQEINNGFVGSSQGKGVTLFVNNKKVNVNYETMNKLLRDVVMLPKHRGGGVMEDRFIDTNPTAKFAKGIEKATDFVTDNSKFSLNEWAARRDNLMRVSLAVDYASKRKWKNLQEMKAGMEEYITKWAPTSTDFTAWESKYARRSLLYYTWLRGITPRIVDSAMTKPGVTTIVPKAMYNLAYANGLNPESIGDPFPEEGMFPDYYKNNVLGPQWRDEHGLWGINPSSPVIEVANTFSKFKAGDPLGNVESGIGQLGSMANPFFRMPGELATSTQAGTGIPIEDKGQYLADNLGGSWLSSASRASGKTFGTGGILDRTDSAAKFNPEDQAEHAKLQLFNFLSGLKLTDYESNSALKSAGYDMAEKARNEGILDVRRN